MYNLASNQKELLINSAYNRFNYLLNQNGFNKQAKNKLALRNRAIDYAFNEKDCLLSIGTMNGLCSISKDVITCQARSIHYGKPIGTVLKHYGFPLNWLSDNLKAQIKLELRNEFNFDKV